MNHSNQWGAGSKRGKGITRNGAVLLIKLLVFCIGATVISMPFLVSFLSTLTDYETSTLEQYLLTSKVSHQSVPNHLWYQHSLEDPPEDSPYTILHTITTRFMVGQATSGNSKQLDIQTARYLLFETFCWPTIQQQTSMNFFWIVLVDPDLEPTIIQGMMALLGNKTHFPAQNAFLVLTNNTNWSSDGVGVENSTSYGVGLQPVAQEFKEGTLDVITGKTDYLLRALDSMDGNNERSSSYFRKSQKPLLVIETLLDADDGLNNGAVEWIQNTAIQRTREHWDETQRQQEKPTTYFWQSSPAVYPSLNTTWWFLCGTDHIEWHNRQIFQLTEEQYAQTGITSGIAGFRQSPLFCTSAGFTRIGITAPQAATKRTSPSYSHMVFPKNGYSNHALTFYFPECTPYNATIVPNGNYSACWHREFAEKIYIVKSRTITSDSMDHLNVGKTNDYRDISWLNASDFPLLINDTERMWGVLGTEFAINRTKARETSAFIFEHRQSIIKQNKNSRCSPGFPCWKTAKKNLVKMERYWIKQKIHTRELKRKEEATKQRAIAVNETTTTDKKDNESYAFVKSKKINDQKRNPANLLDNDLSKSMGLKKNSIPKAKRGALMGVNQTNIIEMDMMRDNIRKSISEAIQRGTPKMDETITKTHEKTDIVSN